MRHELIEVRFCYCVVSTGSLAWLIASDFIYLRYIIGSSWWNLLWILIDRRERYEQRATEQKSYVAMKISRMHRCIVSTYYIHGVRGSSIVEAACERCERKEKEKKNHKYMKCIQGNFTDK